MAKLSPYLNFDGNCCKAMNFYRDCLGGELHLKTVGEVPENGSTNASRLERGDSTFFIDKWGHKYCGV